MFLTHRKRKRDDGGVDFKGVYLFVDLFKFYFIYFFHKGDKGDEEKQSMRSIKSYISAFTWKKLKIKSMN